MTRGAIAVVTLLVLSLLTPVGAVAAAGATETVTLTVAVVNQSGDPVKNAELTASWGNGSTTETTASNGKAFVDVPKGADVEISISHADYIRNHPYVVKDATEQEVRVPVSRQGTLAVTVVDDSGPLANAQVTVRKEGRIAVAGKTGDDGSYTTGDIERGEYTVSVLKPGYFRNTTSVTVDAAAKTRLSIERGSVSLTVAVRDPHFTPPKPVAGATVAIKSIGQFTTLPEGKASVSVPVNTDFSVIVTKEGYEKVVHDVRVRESNHRENISLSRTPSVSITPVNRRVVAGEKVVVKVTDEYGSPIAGAAVLLDGEQIGETDQSGQLSVAIEESGDHTLIARTGKLRSEPATVTAIRANDETATTTPTATPTPTQTRVGVPGFGVSQSLVALALVVVAVLALARRR